MIEDGNRKTSHEHWEASHGGTIRFRLPSTLNVGTRDILRLLALRIKPDMNVLEVGFAPGKHLAYVAKKLHGRVHGVDYSERGVETARQLFKALAINGDLRCEDFFCNTFRRISFDFVYSIGLVEHFEDPGPIVRLHLEMVKPGGKVMIVVPNYGGIYGRLQSQFDPKNLAIHNLRLMSISGLRSSVPGDLSKTVNVSPAGCISPWILSLDQWMLPSLARFVSMGINAVGLIQPFQIRPLCPMLVLDITRTSQV